MYKIFIEVSGNLEHPKNLKSINNISIISRAFIKSVVVLYLGQPPWKGEKKRGSEK